MKFDAPSLALELCMARNSRVMLSRRDIHKNQALASSATTGGSVETGAGSFSVDSTTGMPGSVVGAWVALRIMVASE